MLSYLVWCEEEMKWIKRLRRWTRLVFIICGAVVFVALAIKVLFLGGL